MPQDPAFLETAAFLGRRLCRDALWAGQRCNWLGDSMEYVDNAWTVVHRALSADLYGGTSGIALFLARLYRLTGERLFRTTARGAATQAMSRASDIPPSGRLAFYAGWTGLAYALTELSEASQDDALLERALTLIPEAARDAGEHAGLDVIGGRAGAIPVLIDLDRRHPGRQLSPLAVDFGEHIIASARRSESGWSWNTLDGQTERDPTGFSHGAAGIAWALLELYKGTGEVAFREAAEQGFAYERRWFSSEHDNWPDFRKIAAPQSGSATANFAVAWCHGAPGIGLSRLRGYEILGTKELKREAEAAIRTTTRGLAQSAPGSQGDFTLCHGRGGNAELLIYADQVLGDKDSRAVAEGLGRQGIDYFRRNDLPWPCGVPGGGENPSLMLGLAGIGYFYLRLYDPTSVPSVLIIRPSEDTKPNGHCLIAGDTT
jgi:lantibiotic biosynthesis protein